jgi:hypothetical protein
MIEVHCQSKSNQSHKSQKQENSGCKLTPFGLGDCSVFLEVIAVVEVAVLVEMVAYCDRWTVHACRGSATHRS